MAESSSGKTVVGKCVFSSVVPDWLGLFMNQWCTCVCIIYDQVCMQAELASF